MHIKQLTIQGFRSYREELTMEPFSSRHNVIVGRNGSGKSNFFRAIQFVLGDDYTPTNEEERHGMLHEGTGPRVITAYVDIILDNSDRRIPVNKTQFTLQRRLGSKKDQFFLDRKQISKYDVMKLLESAGFSKGNPYYIVKQGKVHELATAKDNQRLKVLKDVSGMRTYDQSTAETGDIFTEMERKMRDINLELELIGRRVVAVEGEKKDLQAYREWDRKRRTLEYNIYDRDYEDTRKHIEELKERKTTCSADYMGKREQQKVADDSMKELNKEIREWKSKIQDLENEMDLTRDDQKQNIKEKEILELNIGDLQDQLAGDISFKVKAEDELKIVKGKIALAEERLENIVQLYEAARHREEAAVKELSLNENRRKELYAKQSRSYLYTTARERDQWITGELRSLRTISNSKERMIGKLQTDLITDQSKMDALELQIQKNIRDIEKYKDILKKNYGVVKDTNNKKNDIQDKRNALWRKENGMQQMMVSLSEELKQTEQALRSITGKAVLNGIDSVQKALQSFRDNNCHLQAIAEYHGTVIDNFEVERTFFTAVEVTAGKRLFSHIVESDWAASVILAEINRLRLPGAVAFLPLNKLLYSERVLPQGPDVLPLIGKLNYQGHLHPAMMLLFSQTLMCRNMEVATRIAKSENLDCVTLEGDQVNRRGALTGGYHDLTKSLLILQKDKTNCLQKLQELKGEHNELTNRLANIDSEITQLGNTMTQTEIKSQKHKAILDTMQANVRQSKEVLHHLETSKASKEHSLANLQSSLETMRTSAQTLEAEKGTNLAHLSAEEEAEVQRLNDQLPSLITAKKDAERQRTDLETEKIKLEHLLSSNLNNKVERLTQNMQEMTTVECRHKLDVYRADLETINSRISHNENLLQVLDTNINKENHRLQVLMNRLEAMKQEKEQLEKDLIKASKVLERMTQREGWLLYRKAKCLRDINALGPRPQGVFDKYKAHTLDQLHAERETCIKELKKCGSVNPLAYDQYQTFGEMQEALTLRLHAVHREAQAVQELLEILEYKKFEAIELTFKQVSKYFTDIFKKIVPHGQAMLVMKRDPPREGENGEEASSEGRHLIDQFTGVGIRVSFTGLQADMTDMVQLSGGQKSLLALTLIFAIQKCDPAPFYLFDEIDQALDPNHRRAVADIIHELSKDTQFITTTFRPELLDSANKFYGVTFRHRVSHVQCCDYNSALEFVEESTSEG